VKVLLIFPPQKHYAVGKTIHMEITVEAGGYPPIGLLYIASYLKKNTDYEVKVLDAHNDKLDYRQLREYISKERPDVVGIYTSTYFLYDTVLTARTVKEISNSIKVVAGGPHFYFYPEHLKNAPEIDFSCYGEGELLMKELIDRLAAGGTGVEDIPGIMTSKNPKAAMQRIDDINQLPFPDRIMINYRNYRSILAAGSPVTTIISSRGCPFNCYFCGSIVGGRKVRFRAAGNIVDELESCMKLGIRDFLFFDEIFTFDKKRVIEICRELIKRRLNIRFHIRSRADTIDEEMLIWLKKAGCRLIQFGIESGTEHIQKVLNKNLKLDKVREVIKQMKKIGIQSYGDFMLGSPEESIEEMKQTISFARELNLDYAQFETTHVVPCTEFYRMALEQGRFKNDVWQEYVNNPSKQIEETVWNVGQKKQIEELNRHAFIEYYLRSGYIIRKIMAIDSFQQILWQLKSAIKVFGRFILRSR